MTIVGYRCKRGKVEYLLQNSWGVRACNLYKNSKDIDCDDKKDPGKVWMTEELLSKGVLQLNQPK